MRQASLPTNSPQDIMAWVRSLWAAPPYFPCFHSSDLPDFADFYHTTGTRAIFIIDQDKPAWAGSSGWLYADGTPV